MNEKYDYIYVKQFIKYNNSTYSGLLLNKKICGFAIDLNLKKFQIKEAIEEI